MGWPKKAIKNTIAVLLNPKGHPAEHSVAFSGESNSPSLHHNLTKCESKIPQLYINLKGVFFKKKIWTALCTLTDLFSRILDTYKDDKVSLSKHTYNFSFQTSQMLVSSSSPSRTWSPRKIPESGIPRSSLMVLSATRPPPLPSMAHIGLWLGRVVTFAVMHLNTQGRGMCVNERNHLSSRTSSSQ